MRLGLGTVQFGMNYGVSNYEGQSSIDEINKILKTAREYGITLLDTAPLYGRSEIILGTLLGPNHKFNIITKTPKLIGICSSQRIKFLEKTFYNSLKRLKQQSIYGLLIHNANDLYLKDVESIIECMQLLKIRGLVEKVGISVYTSNQIEQALKYRFDLIQVPVNILDQRLIKNGFLNKIKQAGIEIHARSVFLQGLLLMSPQTLPPYFKKVKEHLTRYHNDLKEKEITPLWAALNFVMSIDTIDCVIVGVNNNKQLEEILQVEKSLLPINYNDYAIDDEEILNPSNWKI